MENNLVIRVLESCKEISPVIPKYFLDTSPYIFDFTEKNKELAKIDFSDIKKFINYVFLN